MIVNGVTLPDIPDEAKVYSNFVVMRSIQPGSEAYMLIGCAGGTLVVKDSSPLDPSMPDVYHSWLYLSKPLGIYERFEDGEWTFDSGASGTGYQMLPMPMVTAELDGELMSIDVFWADHVVMEATLDSSGVPVSTGIQYYPKVEEEPKPTRVSIGRSLVDGYAKEVQRLTGTTEQMNAVQIREKLSTVKAGIKIGDTVLPPIPDGVLAEYPYATIIYASSTDDYVLMACDSVFYYATKEVSGIFYADGILVGQSGVGTVYSCNADASEWTRDEELNELFTPIGEMVVGGSVYGVYTLLWANHDICIATTFTSPTEVIIGTEIYFSERQNFNGVWLPKIPDGFFAEKPKGLLYKRYDQDDPNYYLTAFSGEGFFVSSEVLAPMGVPIEGEGAILYDQPDTTYWCRDGDLNKWYEGNPGEGMVPIGNMFNSRYEFLWANFDIHEVTEFDPTTGAHTLGGLYYPPLPAIDTDRVSIGYDLCDGIVEEVQRLSGESEKMNALHAYWKLTTVV